MESKYLDEFLKKVVEKALETGDAVFAQKAKDGSLTIKEMQEFLKKEEFEPKGLVIGDGNFSQNVLIIKFDGGKITSKLFDETEKGAE